MAAHGVTPQTLVVAYDASGGMYAAHLWWMLRWLGHERVAVLDGGWQAWTAAGLPVSTEPGVAARPGQPVEPGASLAATVDAATVLANIAQPAFTVIDARAATAIAARSNPWTRWPATSRRAEPPQRREPADRRPLQGAGAVARRVHGAAGGPRSGRHRASVRLGHHRLPQSAVHGNRRPVRFAPVSGFVERVVQRPVASGGHGRRGLRAGAGPAGRHEREKPGRCPGFCCVRPVLQSADADQGARQARFSSGSPPASPASTRSRRSPGNAPARA